MEIITYNFIIIFCHLVEVAIFAVGDFFSLFGIAVFNVPITHKLCFLLFLMQRYNLFFLFTNFFLTFFIVCLWIYLQRQICFMLFRVPLFSGGVLVLVLVLVLVVSPDDYLHTIIHTRIHTRAHARARGFLDSNF